MLVERGGTSYHIDDALIKRWDKIKDGRLAKIDEDRVYIVDGYERSGKSLWTIQQAAYIDESILFGENLPHIAFTPEELLEAIRKTKSTPNHTRVVIFDEAFRGLSNRASLSKTNRIIIQALMEMGQSNLVLFIVLPSFFMLDRYPAIIRSKALFHIQKANNSRQRSWQVYSFVQKMMLFQRGMKKGWLYDQRKQNKGRFFNKYPGGDDFEARYRKKKYQSLYTLGIYVDDSDKKGQENNGEDGKKLDIWEQINQKGLTRRQQEYIFERNLAIPPLILLNAHNKGISWTESLRELQALGIIKHEIDRVKAAQKMNQVMNWEEISRRLISDDKNTEKLPQ